MTHLITAFGSFIFGALCIWLTTVREQRLALNRATDRVEDVEDRMLKLAGRHDVAPAPEFVRGKTFFIDEAREVELDETRA